MDLSTSGGGGQGPAGGNTRPVLGGGGARAISAAIVATGLVLGQGTEIENCFQFLKTHRILLRIRLSD